jgi:hypothetical protein
MPYRFNIEGTQFRFWNLISELCLSSLIIDKHQYQRHYRGSYKIRYEHHAIGELPGLLLLVF